MGDNCGYVKISSESFNIDEISDLKKLRAKTEVIGNQLVLKERL